MSGFRSAMSSEQFFAKILVTYLIGITCFYALPVEFFSTLKISCCLLFCILVLLNIFYRRLKLYRNKTILGVLMQFQVCLLGGWNVMEANDRYKPTFFANAAHDFIDVQVVEEPVLRGSILNLSTLVIQTFNLNKRQLASGKLNIAIRLKENLNINYGDRLILPARYEEVQECRNPATFDYKKWLGDQGIYHQGFFKLCEVIKLKGNYGNPWIKFAQETRAKQLIFLKEHLKSTDATAFAAALILGYRTDLDPDLLTVYANTGTIHALSVSGMHVGLIYFLLNFLLDLVSRRKLFRMTKYILIFLLIWFYATMTGLSPSVLRSAIMLSVFIVGKAFNKSAGNHNILAFTALIMLITTPNIIWDVGFELSFLAVLGLVMLNRTISSWWHFKNRLFRVLWNAASLSIAAQLATYPLSIYYFHRFPIYFLFANIVTMLPLSVLMYLGIFILIFRIHFLIPVFEWLIGFTNSILTHIAKLPFSTLEGIWIDKTELILISGSIVFVTIALLHYQKKYLIFGLLTTFIFSCIASYKDYQALKQKQLVIYVIKDHYAIAFIEGRTAIVLTDLVRSDHIYKRQVQPYLEQRRTYNVQLINAKQQVKEGHLDCSKEQIKFFNYYINKSEIIKPRSLDKKAIITNIE
ncbi:ComEC/Rec2 family competence protein [Pedobacter sp. PWIIR3]